MTNQRSPDERAKVLEEIHALRARSQEAGSPAAETLEKHRRQTPWFIAGVVFVGGAIIGAAYWLRTLMG